MSVEIKYGFIYESQLPRNQITELEFFVKKNRFNWDLTVPQLIRTISDAFIINDEVKDGDGCKQF
jgi:hypothetical protein